MKQSERVVLDEARRIRLPVQMLVNKADRLSAPDLARVMEGVVQALDETKIGAWSPPIAFSAKRALSERLGSIRPLARCRGARRSRLMGRPVQALLDRQIVGSQRGAEGAGPHAGARRSSSAGCSTRGRRRDAAAERAAAARDDDRARAAAHAATRIERDADAIAERLAASLSPDVADWKRDLDLVFIGRDRDAADRDPVLARYRVDRGPARLSRRPSRASSPRSPRKP